MYRIYYDRSEAMYDGGQTRRTYAGGLRTIADVRDCVDDLLQHGLLDTKDVANVEVTKIEERTLEGAEKHTLMLALEAIACHWEETVRIEQRARQQASEEQERKEYERLRAKYENSSV